MKALNSKQRSLLLKIARYALEHGLQNVGSPYSQKTTDDPDLNRKLPCFVTLLSHSGKLRGCIGSLSTDDTLFENAQTYAINAATADPRFDPIQADEVDRLIVEMSVIGPMKPLPNLSSLEIGLHGLCIRHGSQSGVLLAKVASEQNWDNPTFVHQTCHKAGLDSEKIRQYDISYFEEISFSEKDE